MSRIIVLSAGTHTCARDALPNTKAIVTSGLSTLCAKLYADIFKIPFLPAQEVFRLSPQAVRYSATRLRVLECGVAVYHPLDYEWLAKANWPIAKGSSPALLTAYMLALAHGCELIQYRLARRDEVVPMSFGLLQKLREQKIKVQYLT
jgi:hypothetical protein